jgi:hypothetical protein
MNRIPFTINAGLQSYVDESGRKYIINPITKERIYQVFPKLLENTDNTPVTDKDWPIIPIYTTRLKIN